MAQTPESLDGSTPSSSGTAFVERYPNIAFWVKKHGWIAVGYDYNSDTCVRAIDEGGMPWGGGDIHGTVDEWMRALEKGVGEFIEEQGLR